MTASRRTVKGRDTVVNADHRVDYRLMILRPADELCDLVTRMLRSAGADERNALAVAEHLVLANLCGVDTHGVWQLAGYVKDIRAGLIGSDRLARSFA